MKKIAFALFMVVASVGFAIAQDMTAEQVMDKYIVAIGGKELVSGIKDMTVEMSAETERGPIMVTRKMMAPNKSSMVINASGMEVMRMTSDGVKTAMGSMQGSRVLEGKDAQAGILQGTLFPELRYAEMGLKNTLDVVEKVDGKDAYKITHTSADGTISWTDFYDKESGLKVQSVSTQKMMGRETIQTTQFTDYKDFKGLKYPTTVKQMGGRDMTSTVDKVKINTGAKESDFVVK
jgi:hypothetical protein